MFSKHVEAWNKLIIKFSAPSWLMLRYKYIEMHGQQNIKKKEKSMLCNTLNKNGLFVLLSRCSFLVTLCFTKQSIGRKSMSQSTPSFLSVVSFNVNMTLYPLLWSLEFRRKFLKPKLFSVISTFFLISGCDLSLSKKTWLSVYFFLSLYSCLSTRFVE